MKKSRAKHGYVYILTRPFFSFVKIGYTIKATPETRCMQVGHEEKDNGSFPFSVAYSVRVKNAPKIEREIHKLLSETNVAREYFRVGVDEFKTLIRWNFQNKMLGLNAVAADILEAALDI